MDESLDLSKIIIDKNGVIEFLINDINDEILSNIKELIQSNISYGDIIWPKLLPNDSESVQLIGEIENLLKENNNNYTRFSSDFTHGILSYHVYGEIKMGDTPFNDQNINRLKSSKKSKKNQLKNNWKIIQVFVFENLYQSALYFNKYMGHLILSHKGIDSKKLDIFSKDSTFNTNIKGIICNEYVPQLVKCYEVTEYCYKTAIEKKCTLSFTGYSNGAWLSEYSIYFCERYIKPMYSNDYRVELKAVLFESPGIFRDDNESKSNIISSEIDFDLRNMNIVNYLISPNLMNSCNFHIGTVYRLYIENKDNDNADSQKFFEEIKKFKLIGDFLSKNMEKSHFIYNGLYHTFNHSVLRFILEECFENEKPKNFCKMRNWPLLKIEFDKDYKQNFKKYLSKPLEYFASRIPFLSTVTTPFTYVTSNLIQCLAQKVCPGIVILLNVLIEIAKGNVNLDFLDSSLFYQDVKSIQNIIIDKEYITKKYALNKREIFKKDVKKNQETIEKKIENKFKLLYLFNYEPLFVCEKSKLLKIEGEYKRNIDWCFFNLHFWKGNDLNFDSKILYKQLLDLKSKYEIQTNTKDENDIHIIRKIDNEIDFDKLKELFLRLISISKQDLKSIISIKDYKKNIFAHNLGERMENFIFRGNLLNEIDELFKTNNCILLYGPPGIGKTTIAKEFCMLKFLQQSNVWNFESEYKLSLENSYRHFVLKILESKYESSKIEELIDIGNKIIHRNYAKTYFIFDNVENYEIIKPFVTGILQSDRIKILITSRSENNVEINIKKIKVKFFNVKEAFLYIKKNDKNHLEDSEYSEIISMLNRNDEINPKELEIITKSLNRNFFFEKDFIKKITNSKRKVFDFIYEKMLEERFLLEIISYLNPDKISIEILKKIFDNVKIEHFEKLESYGLILINRKEKSISIHRIIRDDIRNYFLNQNSNKIMNSILNLVNFIKENDDQYDELYEHLSIIDKEIIYEIKDLNDIKMRIKKKLREYFNRKNYFHLSFEITKEIFYLITEKFENNIEEYSEAMFYTAVSYRNLGNDFKALEYEIQAYELRKRLFKKVDHLDIAHSLYGLGVSNTRLGNDQKALQYYLQAYEMRKRLFKDVDHSDIAQSLNSLALSYIRLGDDRKALEYDIQAYEMRKRLFKDVDHSDIAHSLYGLAVSYTNNGDDQKAFEYILQAYKMRKRLFKRVDHSDIAQSLNSLAVSYTRLGDDQKALKYDLQAYEMRKRLFKDVDHSDIAQSLYSLAVTYIRVEDDQKAFKCILKAYKMRKRLFRDVDHSDLAHSLYGLALSYNRLGDDQKALEYDIQAYEMRKRLFKEEDHSEITHSLYGLAVSYTRLGDDQKAFQYYLEAYKMRKRLFKVVNHSKLHQSLNSLSLSYIRLGDDKKALEYKFLIFEIPKRLFKDVDHSDLNSL